MNESRIPPVEFPLLHHINVQLRFNDIDMFGHLNNTVYLEFFDLGKLRYFETVMGEELMNSELKVVVANINCNFFSPTFLHEKLEVLTGVSRIGEKSLSLEQRICNAETGDVKCTATTIMVGFDTLKSSSAAIPDSVRAAFSKFEGRKL